MDSEERNPSTMPASVGVKPPPGAEDEEDELVASDESSSLEGVMEGTC